MCLRGCRGYGGALEGITRSESKLPPTGRPTILVVDDTPENISLMNGLLKDHHRTRSATGGKRALKAEPRNADIPVVFLTAKSEIEDEQTGFDAGAVDYITKPISPPIVMARVKTHLTLKLAADFLRDKNGFLEAEVRRRTHEVESIQDVTIMAMASLAETRDNEMSDETVEMLYKSAPLHEIGKVGIPDAILLKPGKLTPEEFEIMKSHTTLGRDTIAAAENLFDAPSIFLRLAREIAHYHQEKWDGSGYPEGLAGEAIPLSARLMAVADVYDALISRRVYQPPFTHNKAVQIIVDGRGTHFDPRIVDAFIEIDSGLRAVATRFSDGEAEIYPAVTNFQSL